MPGLLYLREAESRISEQDGTAETEKRETQNRRQGEPGKNRTGTLGMFGTPTHIVPF